MLSVICTTNWYSILLVTDEKQPRKKNFIENESTLTK